MFFCFYLKTIEISITLLNKHLKLCRCLGQIMLVKCEQLILLKIVKSSQRKKAN